MQNKELVYLRYTAVLSVCRMFLHSSAPKFDLLEKKKLDEGRVFVSGREECRFDGVVVITSASHAEGREFKPRSNLVFLFFLRPFTDQFGGRADGLLLPTVESLITSLNLKLASERYQLPIEPSINDRALREDCLLWTQEVKNNSDHSRLVRCWLIYLFILHQILLSGRIELSTAYLSSFLSAEILRLC